VQYLVAPGTIKTRNTLQDAIRLLPLAQGLAPEPLTDRARLIIDSIGVNAPIVFGVPNDNEVIYKRLEDGVVHYSDTPKPGTPGTAVILGHSSAYPWYDGDYGAVFALLSKLNPGDRFYIQYSDNRMFVYEVKQAVIFNPFTQDDRLAALGNAPGNFVILLSCYPVGTNYKRIAIQAQQVQI
jgi:LPXTG-site transpeptidase (sortase) family protein